MRIFKHGPVFLSPTHSGSRDFRVEKPRPVLKRITYEEPIQSLPALIELVDIVAALQLLNLERGH